MQISFLRSRSRQKSKTSDKVIIGLGYPAVFHWTMLLVLLGLLIYSAFEDMVPLTAATVLLLVLAVLPRFWSRYAFRNLSGTVSTSPDHAFPDEKIELSFELSNRGLPLPWLEIEMELPYRLTTGKRSLSPYTWERLRWVTSISRGQVLTWKHTIEAKSRGDYHLGPLRLRSGDMFGLFPNELVLSNFQSLLVYPRIFPLNKLNFPLKTLFGEKAGPRSIYDDTSRVAGARDYRYSDPLKHIHWKVSAARSKLHTRQYESSTSLSLILMLDVYSFPEENEEFEHAVSTVASLAYEADRQGFAVGLITNNEPEVQIAPGSGQNHLMKTLEALARIKANSRISFYEQRHRFRTIFPVGATMVLVTLTKTPILVSLASQLEQDGYSIRLISIDQMTEQERPVIGSLNGMAYS